MQCQICNKNDATIHLTEIAEGIRTEMHICEQCAAEQNIAVKNHIPINELLSNLLASQPAEDEISISEEKIACPNCGFTLAQFRKEGVMGCPYDYEIFEKQLESLIEKAHTGSSSHCGKVPVSTPQDTKQQMKLLQLRKKLDLAVQTEDYETAAMLRDQIKQIEG